MFGVGGCVRSDLERGHRDIRTPGRSRPHELGPLVCAERQKVRDPDVEAETVVNRQANGVPGWRA